MSEVQRIGSVIGGRGRGGVLQQAELGGGELRYLGSAGTTVGAEPFPTGPARGGDHAVQVGPERSEQHQSGLVFDHRMTAGCHEGRGLAGIHRQVGIEHVFDTTEGP